MSCCGNKRAQLSRQNQAPAASQAGAAPGHAPGHIPVATVYFQYTGQTALSVRGMFSRHTYRFAAPGAVAVVDGRDAPSLAAVPNLKRIKVADEANPGR